MTFFHGEGKRGPYFEGWYFKHQSPEGRTLALIPAFHVDAAGDAGASIQIIGDTGSWWLENPDGTYLKDVWYQSPESGLWYYMGGDGYMLTNTTTPDNLKVDANGVWVQ